MLHLDYRDPRPIYEQIRQEFMRLILSGAIAPGEKLPSVRDLAGTLSINPNTIQRAYRELEAAGYLISVPGKGHLPLSQAPCRRRKSRSSSRRSAPLPGRLSCSVRRETSCSRSWTQRRKKHD